MSDPSSSQVPLPHSVEQLIQNICKDQSQPPPDPVARRELALLGEPEALEILHTISGQKIYRSFSGFIMHLAKRKREHSPQNNRTTARLVNSPMSGQLVALGELEFRKQFLILSYLAGKRLEEAISAEKIRALKDLPMLQFEIEVWNALGQFNVQREDRIETFDWDTGKTHIYHCHVSLDGSCRFKGPFLDKTRTFLHSVLGDDNVLMVKFEEEADRRNLGISSSDYYANKYSRIAREGILVGLRRYCFFVFKGGKEGKKKDPTASSVKCYFVRMESNALIDEGQDYILSGKTVREARCVFMHVHTMPSVANYMARFSLILSKTMKLDVDFASVNVERIDDIRCQDEDGNDVYDKDGKPLIHTDGTGFISEDLASKCPKNIYKGKCGDNVERFLDRSKGKISEMKWPKSHREEPPLLIQFRLFYNGSAVKGTFLLNKKLDQQTIKVRSSMIKVETDPKLSNTHSENSLEVVGTSHKPRKTRLSRNLIALLSYGGVPKEFFLGILIDTLNEAQCVFSNKRAALKVSLNYGEMDDFNAAKMILSGIPLDESHLQYCLSILSKEEKKSLEAGKLPIPESYYLMGTTDPTGILESNEVCIILENGQISGKVLVYRNPGLHFGDIHVLEATYVKALEDFVGNAKYAIFFPCKGSRSLADEIAGSDFDGDMYFVSKNPELLNNFKESERWTSASPKRNVPSKRPSEFSNEELEDELFKLFLTTRFEPSYTLGEASDSWLAFMDRLLTLGEKSTEEKAIVKENMCRLIDIYYDALDLPKKSGIKIDVPEELKAKAFPHYMEKEWRDSFNSTSILGLIYEKVKSYEAEDLSNIKIWKLPHLNEEVPEACMGKWKEYYDEYRQKMRAALQHGGEGKNEAADEVIKYYKQKLYGAAAFEESERNENEIYEEALAIYHIAYDYAMSKGNVKYCSFAWKVAGPVLCILYASKQGERTMLCTPSVLKEVFS